MTNTEGFLFIILMIDLFFGLAGLCVLLASEWLIHRIPGKFSPLILFVAGFCANVYLALRFDTPLTLASSAVILVPLSALAPLYLRQTWRNGMSFSRILACFLVLWLVSVILPFILVWSGLSMHPFIYWHTWISNSTILACVWGVYILVSWIMYAIMDRIRLIPPVPEKG